MSLPTAPAWDVVVVPGCPSEADGALSWCQWRRAIWLSTLWEEGLVPRAITSGSDVHNPYRESEAIRAGALALGVPADRVALETQALHTDENIAYSLALAEALGARSVAVATEGFQGEGMCAMAERWGWPCTVLALDERRVRARLRQPLPDVRTAPREGHRSVAERERARAAAEGEPRRRPSWLRYAAMARRGRAGLEVPMPRPPRPEPTQVEEAAGAD